ncbi:MAG: LysM peptidoglycan-binding domain-containing protein [Treponema sp.]|nr:LysM peptidoglycan-binding domain-containing protein [Treponema sp.]
MASTIGIKIANGEFYPILEENSKTKKRLILTTVHDNQQSVQIDLYKSSAKTMTDAMYIGSLVVENIKNKTKGEPSVEMVISSDEKGEITADAIDLDNSARGEHYSLNVSLRSFDEDTREYDLPDFELGSHDDSPPQGLYEKASAKKKEKPRHSLWLFIILAGLLIIFLCLALWFFLFRGKNTGKSSAVPAAPAERAVPAEDPASPPVQSPPPAALVPAEPAAPAASPPVIQAPPAPAPAVTAQQPPARTYTRNRPAPPVASFKVPARIPREGVPYTIRWGDTLWDISEAFYRNPWLYPRIARFNNIRNPDRIISGATIRIPPRN